MANFVYKVADIVYRFLALNILWVFFFIIGLGVFGFMPSTVALFRIVREWIKGNRDLPMFRSYYMYFKEEFISSNIIGFIYAVLFYIIYVNFSFVPYFYDESIHIYLYVVISAVSLVLTISYLNAFSVMAHFKHKKVMRYFVTSIGLVFAKPMSAIIQVFWIVAYTLIAINYPKLFIPMGISVLAYVLMSFNYSIFSKLKIQ